MNNVIYLDLNEFPRAQNLDGFNLLKMVNCMPLIILVLVDLKHL